MIELKISLNLLVQGAGMVSLEESRGNSNCDVTSMTVIDRQQIEVKGKGKNKKTITKTIDKKEKIVVYTRKSKLISQHINICKEAYDYMLNVPTSAKLARVTGPKGKREWDKLSIDQKLRNHFDQIADTLGAVSYTYEILDD